MVLAWGENLIEQEESFKNLQSQWPVPHCVEQYFGFNARPGGGLCVLENAFGPEPKVRDLLAGVVVETGPMKGRSLEGGAFLSPATARTLRLWERLNDLFVEERRKGVLDVSQVPSSITAHAPGYIDRDNETVVWLQTDAPLKRAIMPNGGFRMVLGALKAYGYEPDPHVVEAFTKYRKTHNEGVLDAYTEDIRRCRRAHVLTGLPDAYGRGGCWVGGPDMVHS